VYSGARGPAKDLLPVRARARSSECARVRVGCALSSQKPLEFAWKASCSSANSAHGFCGVRKRPQKPRARPLA